MVETTVQSSINACWAGSTLQERTKRGPSSRVTEKKGGGSCETPQGGREVRSGGELSFGGQKSQWDTEGGDNTTTGEERQEETDPSVKHTEGVWGGIHISRNIK